MNSLGAWFHNTFLNRKRYRVHQDAVVISCFYNPQNNPYRLVAFQKWYNSIKHTPHRIIECLIGPNAKSQLPKSKYITQVKSDSLLWHKETLLNKIVSELPAEYRYVFWVDADVLFTNLDWIRDGVRELQESVMIQPFEYCVHLKKGEFAPDFDVDMKRVYANTPGQRHPQLWASFCSVQENCPLVADSHNYDEHGHVGFAWGARRELLDQCPMYDKALIGGADHIMAHAAVGHIPNSCVRRAHPGDIESVEKWSREFYRLVDGNVGFVHGDLYHIWHGDIKARNYYHIVPEFSADVVGIDARDANGLYVGDGKNDVVKKHYPRREASDIDVGMMDDAEFFLTMGYHLADLASEFGQPTYDEPVYAESRAADVDSFSNTMLTLNDEVSQPSVVVDESLVSAGVSSILSGVSEVHTIS